MNLAPPKDLFTKWLAALRSGEYKQAAGVLKNSEGYCCLGVLCEIAGLEQHDTPLGVSFGPENDRTTLPTRLSAHMGLRSENGAFTMPHAHLVPFAVTVNGVEYDTLTQMNDGTSTLWRPIRPALTFAQIADAIEQNQTRLFAKPLSEPSAPPSLIS
jgi:hypothetical protein